ncbi:hypothetical protein Pst134EA_013536 [Puccinia striiformis f. sp. tritici]|uniref:hypothetical protein n=1 Tax=Puccinia striiformis f. sp. tritici TaxID=168172 RepID=UPI0020084575|nr:hypothetical protein Pst134EA_013536 [Puccinia striiformis f. sp. tritici]KAH9465653.1 hypothetical protein Pst134EA_013536 [Puccinia striiformis f. sp. tritici]
MQLSTIAFLAAVSGLAAVNAGTFDCSQYQNRYVGQCFYMTGSRWLMFSAVHQPGDPNGVVYNLCTHTSGCCDADYHGQTLYSVNYYQHCDTAANLVTN